MTGVDQYLDEHRPAFVSDLCQWLSIPSVSTDPGHRQDVRRAGQWVAGELQRIGLDVELLETGGHPIIYAQSPPVPGKPVALVYGHYDVQPPDPLGEWRSPPFEPTIRDGNIYARGATDDKGQLLTHIKSVQAWMETVHRLPVQVKYLIEGEEEIGSEHLAPFVADHQEKLACDCVVISDSCQFAPGQPAITYGLRGIAYFEVTLHGPKQDLHSGTFGGAVTNPAIALTRLLAALLDERGRIRIPGFYDDVLPLSDAERAQLGRLPFDDSEFCAQIGVSGLSGEEGYSTLERRWTRPSYDIHGLGAGYQGEGAKTVLPARAGAKFSFRLVPEQQPHTIARQVRALFESLLPAGITMELGEHHASPGIVVPIDSPYIAAAARSIERGFGCPPVFIREGGSIPIVTSFHQQLGADVLLLGWGLDDDNTHSPNEKFSLADFHRGIHTSAQLWEELARM